MARLTKAFVDALRPGEDAYPKFDTGKGAITGFLVRVYPTGRKVAYFQYRLKGAGRRGKPKPFKIGEISDSGLTFTAAQQHAKGLRALVELGGDPAHDEKARALAVIESEERAKERTFKVLADAWLKRKAKLRSYDELKRIVECDDLKPLHRREVAGLTVAELDRIISDIEGRAPTMAWRTLQVVQWVLDLGVKKGWLSVNSAAHIETAGGQGAPRDRVLSEAEVFQIWHAAEGMGFPYGRAIQMLMLTCARRSEVIELDWSEIDADAEVWRLPASRSKNGEAHQAHLAQQTLDLLGEVPVVKKIGRFPRSGFVFTTTGKRPIAGLSKYKRALDKAMLEKMREENPKAKLVPWRLHDIRRTVATGMQKMGIGIAVVERILNHRSATRSGIIGIYQRAEFLPERKAALEAWATRVEALIKNMPPPRNVVSIGEAKRA